MVIIEKTYSNNNETLLEKVEEIDIPINFGVIERNHKKKDINVLSLFSGCGGMDLGLEGGFTVHKNSISNKYNADFIESHLDNGFVELKNTRFRTVFSNDILKEAKTAWIHNFTKRGYDSSIFHSDSIVDLVKMHKAGADIFPQNIDIVTGGFPCQYSKSSFP